ncbi:MAG: DUF99 family protein [Thermoplasmatales archaeon]|nr:DUF99 family protein [Thermoplasmatales archaeon]
MVDQNSLFNKDTRIIAFDDSPFSRRDKHTSIVGVIMRKDLYIESLITKRIEVDGTDATEKILDVIREKGSGIRVIMTQGITLGGFNVLDVKELFRETGIPIINVVDHEPNMKAIKDALKKYFEDWESRYSKLTEDFYRFGPIFVQATGMDSKVAYKFIKQITAKGNIPEPLRLADLIAGAL